MLSFYNREPSNRMKYIKMLLQTDCSTHRCRCRILNGWSVGLLSLYIPNFVLFVTFSGPGKNVFPVFIVHGFKLNFGIVVLDGSFFSDMWWVCVDLIVGIEWIDGIVSSVLVSKYGFFVNGFFEYITVTFLAGFVARMSN